MSAKEMFEEVLEYEYNEYDDQIECVKTEMVNIDKLRKIQLDYFIVFYLDKRTVGIFTNNTNYVNDLSLEELQAINKQVEELGWK